MLREFGFKNKMDFRLDFRHDVSFFSSDSMENTDTFLSAAFFCFMRALFWLLLRFYLTFFVASFDVFFCLGASQLMMRQKLPDGRPIAPSSRR